MASWSECLAHAEEKADRLFDLHAFAVEEDKPAARVAFKQAMVPFLARLHEKATLAEQEKATAAQEAVAVFVRAMVQTMVDSPAMPEATRAALAKEQVVVTCFESDKIHNRLDWGSAEYFYEDDEPTTEASGGVEARVGGLCELDLQYTFSMDVQIVDDKYGQWRKYAGNHVELDFKVYVTWQGADVHRVAVRTWLSDRTNRRTIAEHTRRLFEHLGQPDLAFHLADGHVVDLANAWVSGFDIDDEE
jgi:hypothetical protein